MSTISLSLQQIEDLATRVFVRHGCDHDNTRALVRTVLAAERDGSCSHGLFRVPGYIASLVSGKVNGKARPRVINRTPTIVAVDGDNGFAPLAIERGVQHGELPWPVSSAGRTLSVPRWHWSAWGRASHGD